MRRSDTLATLICTILTLISALSLADGISKSESGAQLSITTPLNGATITSPIHIGLASRMVMLMPEGVPHSGSGHFHIAINPTGAPKPGDSLLTQSKHFDFAHMIDLSKGEKETTITLPPGAYKIQAILGDHKSRAHQPPVLSDIISFTVKAPNTQKTTGTSD